MPSGRGSPPEGIGEDPAPRHADPSAVHISGSKGVVVGDYSTVFQMFASAPRSMSDAMRVADFRALVEERTKGFVGRGFVFDAVASALTDGEMSAGYIVIRGEPGIGKTSLAGQLIKQNGYLHHFNSAPMGIRSAATFLSNICAQLIVRFALDHQVLPPEATEDGGFLSRLLGEAAAVPENRPVVVVVDALDEAEDLGLGSEANRLFLPPVLPTGVFFIVTTREEYDFRLYVEPRRDLFLHDDDPANLADVRAYLRGFVDAHAASLGPRLAGWQVSVEDFVDVLADRSEGNFMYVVQVMRDLRDGGSSATGLEDIRSLPQGLRSYYRRHWQAMRGRDSERFRLYAEPTICLLAAVREPVSSGQVVAWVQQHWEQRGWPVGGFDPRGVGDVIDDWREFLNVDTRDGTRRYRVYHASFQDFLREDVGLTDYHRAISEAALAKIAGFLT